MSEKPAWRRAFDAVEGGVSPRVEAVVHSEEFAKIAAKFSSARRMAGRRANGVAARVWHSVNLPAGSDVQRLRTQVGALDRDVRRLTLQLESRATNEEE